MRKGLGTLERLEEIYEPSLNEVAAVFAAARLGTPRQSVFQPRGLVNSNYRVTTDAGDFLLRIYPEARQPDEVAFELSVLRRLADAGLPGQRPLAGGGADGGIAVGHRPAAILSYLPGRSLRREELSPDIAGQSGLLYAQMQDALREFNPEGSKPDADCALVDPMIREACTELAHRHPEEASLLGAAWASVAEGFRDGSPRTVVHGDLYYENVLVEGSPLRITGIIDFDDAYLGNPLLDLALVASEFAVTADNVLQPELMSAFFEAYRRVSRYPVRATQEELYAALIFVYCKFTCYTLPLQGGAAAYTGGNEYIDRLRDAMSVSGRQSVIRAGTPLAGCGA